jgi:hypothetical protein
MLMKKILLLFIPLSFAVSMDWTFACTKCTKACDQTIEACQACIKETKKCLDATSTVSRECDACKSTSSKLEKRCKVVIVFCNWCIATCNSYRVIGDKVARNECQTYCDKCAAKCKKCATYCKENVKAFKDCKNQNLHKKDSTHRKLVDTCDTCEAACKSCVKQCYSCVETLKVCQDK